MARSTQTKAVAALCAAILSLCSPGFARIIYVDDDANTPGDGSSWQKAYKYLQDALADANDSEKPIEIRVAQGTYKPDRGAGRKTGNVEATFRLINGVAVRGGHAGLAGVDPNARDIDRYESILSGDLGDDDPDMSESWDHIYRPGRNSITVVTGSGIDASAVLDGFTVRGGYYPILDDRINPNNPPPPTGSGGGMNNLRGSPTVIGCTFIGNMSFGAGGGMCNEGGSHPTVIDCAFIRNYAHFGGGGAVANSGNSNPTFTRCTFTENSAWNQGGGVYNRKSGPTFDGCAFIRNSTESKYGSRGGAVYDEESTCTWTDCMFVENNTSSSGGAICSLDHNSLFLERCTFIGNSAETGAAIAGSRDSSLVMIACTLSQNVAHGSAGAVSLGGPVKIADRRFSGNSCQGSGGAADVRAATFTNCLFTGNRAFEPVQVQQGIGVPALGGAVHTGGSIEPLFFINCTFAENRAGYGSAVSTDKPTEFRNCILRGPAPLIWADPYEPQPQVAYSDVEGGWLGAGNSDMDPFFAAPGYWADPNDPNHPGDPNDPNSVWMDGDYHLKSQAGRWDLGSQQVLLRRAGLRDHDGRRYQW